MSMVQVLCPNGRRQNVKITPNTKILQVLEEVCHKQGFLPAEDFNLIHGRKILDVTLSIRFAGIPNNVKLELVKSDSSREEKEVMVALQLESGERLQSKFLPNVTLWDLLLHWENLPGSEHSGTLTRADTSSSPTLHPVCIYMREEIIGEYALKNTTLRNLGLTAGSAVLRLVHRPIDDATYANILDRLEKEQLKQAKLMSLAAKQSQSIQEPSPALLQDKVPDRTPMETVASSMRDNESSGASSGRVTCSKPDQPMDVDQEGNSDSNEASRIPGGGGRSASGGNNAGGREAGAIDRLRELNIPGVDVYTPEDFTRLTAEQQEGKSYHSLDTVNKITPIPEFGKPTDLCEVYLEIKVLASKQATGSNSNKEIPDEFFNVTEQDMRKLMIDQQRKVSDMHEQPLLTEAMRQKQMELKYSHYDRVILRVQFPDKLVLQGTFRPNETVHSLKKFVKEHLEQKNLSFYLYTAPPKCELKYDAKTLMEAQLVPATRIYFGSETNEVHYLSPTVMEMVSTRLEADQIVAKWLSAPMEEANFTTEDDMKSRASKRPTVTGSRSDTDTKGLPKWLKLGKK
ncbi:hypothetical protein ScPMuIL_004561 [Solemya velum]